ncbi:MAG: sulfotransferase family 2 domain-containing protein [Actinomycetota bacterium]
MGRRSSNDSSTARSYLDEFAHLALVSPSLKVLYVPTPKAACTTLKLLLAEAAGSHRPEMADRLAIMHVSRAQTIHHPAVHGLNRFVDLSTRQQREVLGADDWLRIASLRDPVSRAYSAWENRIFMRAHRRTREIIALAHDVSTNGRLDIAASFAHFTQVLLANEPTFMVDHHFWPQSRVVKTNHVQFTSLVRVDQPGEIDAFARLLSERSGRSLAALRLNEGLGVKLDRVCDRATADRVMAVYRNDYEQFGFAQRQWPTSVEPLLLSDTEMRLVAAYRGAFERGISVARESQRRTGARYGMSQMRRALGGLFDRSPIDPKEIQ